LKQRWVLSIPGLIALSELLGFSGSISSFLFFEDQL